MKKTLILLMAMLLCVLCLPVQAEGIQTYVHPNQGYSIDVPAEWLCVDKTNVQDYIAASEAGELAFTGTNKDTLLTLVPQLESTDCTVMINPYANNIVVVKENMGAEFTTEQFVAMLIPMLKQQLENQMPTIQFTAEGDVLPLGDKEFILLSGVYSMNNLPISVDMLFYLHGKDLFTVNLTTTGLFGQEVTDAFYQEALTACGTLTVGE